MMITFLLYLLLIGVVAGYLARLLVPGPDPMNFGATLLLGIAGSFIGGVVGAFVFSGRLVLAPGGIIASVIGAIIALLVYRASRSGRATHSEASRGL
jgi:uncharacterized membrane protein YeaQ/YmgE (transglycosylase-associated protein family)